MEHLFSLLKINKNEIDLCLPSLFHSFIQTNPIKIEIEINDNGWAVWDAKGKYLLYYLNGYGYRSWLSEGGCLETKPSYIPHIIYLTETNFYSVNYELNIEVIRKISEKLKVNS